MPSTTKPAKKVAVSNADGELNPAKPIEPTTGMAMTNKMDMAKKRAFCSHHAQHERADRAADLIAAPASAAVAGATLAAPSNVGVQLSRKK